MFLGYRRGTGARIGGGYPQHHHRLTERIRGLARSHRDLAGFKASDAPVGAGLPAKTPTPL
ncbi:hypothetical protein DV532_01665 [Pseudomonas sp. Leaf58]|nr:hypothetical protein DV532_01665 [Pseudomonas sp. Leaf58]